MREGGREGPGWGTCMPLFKDGVWGDIHTPEFESFGGINMKEMGSWNNIHYKKYIIFEGFLTFGRTQRHRTNLFPPTTRGKVTDLKRSRSDLCKKIVSYCLHSPI